jgi:hypothetical protein
MVGWRDLPPKDLAERVLQIWRLAEERHLPGDVWHVLDAMRARLKFHQRTEQRVLKLREANSARRRKPEMLAAE